MSSDVYGSELPSPPAPLRVWLEGAQQHAAACGCGACALRSGEAEATPSYVFQNLGDRGGTAANGKTSFTLDQAVNRLTGGEGGWGVLGQPFVASYAFRSTPPSVMPSETSGFSRFNAAQIRQTELALQSWADVARISFVRAGEGEIGEAAYSNQAMILLANYSDGPEGAAGFAYYPGSTSFASNSGDVWLNIGDSYNVTPLASNYGGMVLVHEIGHAIGLGHPSEYPDTGSATYGANASYFEDSRQFTVMSYFGGFNTGASLPGFAAVPLIDDIAAVQFMYGANMTTRTGDTVYGFNSNAGRPWFEATSAASVMQWAVWDAGGRDTFDFSGYASNQVIDLRPGHFSNVGGFRGNVAIARGVDIENAITGAGADLITGNALANQLSGGGGADTLYGGDGDDTLLESAGANYLRGDAGNDSVSGGSGFDDINGNMGNDTLRGNAGEDWVVGGRDNDLVFGGEAFDIVYGNMGNDTVDGGAGNDWVRGGQGDDSVMGGAGDDWIWGDRGADTLSGGEGADLFHSFVGVGTDRILDFSFGSGDRLKLEGNPARTISQVGADVVIDMGDGDQVILAGVMLSSLGAGWIV